MADIQIRHLFLLMAVLFVGCGYPQDKLPRDNVPQNKLLQDKVSQNKSKSTGDETLFEGENITVIESVQSNFEQLPFDNEQSERCFQEIDAKIKKKLPDLGFKGNTKYFVFDAKEKFTLRLSKEKFAKINLDLMNKIDSQASLTDSNELYFIKNNKFEYLLLTGHNTGASGYGHYYRYHTLLPLDSNKPMLEFDTLTRSPGKIKIDDSGTVYFIQIDSEKVGAIGDVESTNFPVTVSLLTFDGTSNKKFEFKYDCKSLEDTFSK